MKTIAEQTGIVIEREVRYNTGAFLIYVTKFGNIYGSIVLDVEGKTVESEPFNEVIDDMMTALDQYCPLTAKKPY